jgi:hypothetical protein
VNFDVDVEAEVIDNKQNPPPEADEMEDLVDEGSGPS